jgi:hypothetical protein
MKTTYKGIINGKPTEITFEGENHAKKLTNFCTRFQADSSKFILTKQTKKADDRSNNNKGKQH